MTKEIRQKADKLESDIKELVETFINNVGSCDVNIDCQCMYYHDMGGNKLLLDTDITVDVII
jgi:hypothetical protein